MQRSSYIKGLYRIRFFLALWVVLSHIPFPGSRSMPAVFRLLVNNVFCGVAAVIAFFVISGLCIHFPQRHELRINPWKNLLRRSLRIGIPLAAILGLNGALGIMVVPIWSIYCEEIYYLLYPALLWGRRRWGWGSLLVAAFAGAFALVAWHPHYLNYWENGVALTWLLGLPCWLLGCVLAEQFDSLVARPVPRGLGLEIWAWRAAVVGIAAGLSVARFHAGIGYPITLNIFSLIVFCWLRREILFANGVGARSASSAVTRFFDQAGRGSYSVYVVHGTANAIFLSLAGRFRPGEGVAWLGGLGAALLFSWFFYHFLEKPSHRWSRRVVASPAQGVAGLEAPLPVA